MHCPSSVLRSMGGEARSLYNMEDTYTCSKSSFPLEKPLIDRHLPQEANEMRARFFGTGGRRPRRHPPRSVLQRACLALPAVRRRRSCVMTERRSRSIRSTWRCEIKPYRPLSSILHLHLLLHPSPPTASSLSNQCLRLSHATDQCRDEACLPLASSTMKS